MATNRRGMVRRWLGSVLVVTSALALVPPAAARTAPDPDAFRVVRARSFAAAGGHLFTTATVVEGGRRRSVTAPGGRIGERWERVEPVAPEGSPAAAADERLRDGLFLADAADAEPAAEEGSSRVPTLLGYGWCARQLPVPYRVNRAGLSERALRAVDAGFRTWETEAETFLDFRNVGATKLARARHDGTNVVWTERRTDGFLGYTWIYGSGERIVGFDIVLNRRYRLVVEGLGYDIHSLVLHEAGHAAGFAHSNSRYDVMFPSLAYAAKKRHLGAGDRGVVTTLYGLRDVRAAILRLDPPPDSMRAGETAQVTITFRNVGRTPWGGRYPAAQIRTYAPEDRASPFADDSWIAPNHATNVGGALCRGETATARWTMRAPLLPFRYDETFVLRAGVANPGPPLNDPIRFTISVRLL